MPQQTGQVQVYPPAVDNSRLGQSSPSEGDWLQSSRAEFLHFVFFCSDYPFSEDQSSPCHAHSGTALILFAVQSSKTNNEQVNRSAKYPHPLLCF